MVIRQFCDSFFKTFDIDYLKASTKGLYSAYKTDSERFRILFKEYFSLSVPLVFGYGVSDRVVMLYLLGRYYRNEMFVKDSLVSSNCTKGCDLLAEEFPCLGSRIDVAGVGRKSFAFEIKTQYDNLERLEGQVTDYLKCFERVYVVCNDEKVSAVVDIIPDFCGIIAFSNDFRCSFDMVRDCMCDSPDLSPLSQLSCMKKPDLKRLFKSSDCNDIVREYPQEIINEAFKGLLHKHMAAISSR